MSEMHHKPLPKLFMCNVSLLCHFHLPTSYQHPGYYQIGF